MRTRVLIGALGVALGLFGIFRLLTQIDGYDLFVLGVWLVGALAIHDGLLSPVVVGVGVALRRLPPRARRFAQFGLVAGGLITVIALPLIRQQDKQPRSKAILQQNFTANLAILLGLVAAVSVLGYALSVVRAQRPTTQRPTTQRPTTTKSRESDDQNSSTE